MKTPAAPRSLTPVKAFLALLAILFLTLQFFYLFKEGGSLERYGFFGAFNAFAEVSLRDPITAAGFVDLVVLMVTMIIVISYGVPRVRSRGLIVAALLIVLVVYPALATILFLLLFWKSPDQFKPA